MDTPRSRRIAAALAAALLAGPGPLAGCASVEAPAPVPASAPRGDRAHRPVHPAELSFGEPDFRFPHAERVVLSNGMVVHFVPDRSLPIVDGSAVFRGGSVFDPPGKEGLASLACSMARAGGTASLSPEELDLELDMVAGSVSVSGGEEQCAASFSFLSKDLDRGLEILADVLRRPRYDAARVAQSRTLAAQGVQRALQSPGGVLGRAFGGVVYGDHPYGRVATAASIANITEEDLRAYHDRWFRPDAFILALSGDFDVADMTARLERVFGGWERSPGPLPQWPAAVVREYRGGHWLVPMKGVTQTNIRMGHVGPKQNTVERVHCDVMNLILGGGSFWSRMTRVVRTQEGLAYSVGSWFSRAAQGGAFQASVETKASTSYRAVAIMKRLAEEIRRTPVTEDELGQAKDAILNGFVRVIEDPSSLANQYATLEFKEYPPDWLDRYREIVRNTTVEDVLRAAQEWLRPEGLEIVLVGDPALLDDPATAGLGPAQTLPVR